VGHIIKLCGQTVWQPYFKLLSARTGLLISFAPITRLFRNGSQPQQQKRLLVLSNEETHDAKRAGATPLQSCTSYCGTERTFKGYKLPQITGFQWQFAITILWGFKLQLLKHEVSSKLRTAKYILFDVFQFPRGLKKDVPPGKGQRTKMV
jgi:hypothetical protein